MATTARQQLLTYDDLRQIPADRYRYELFDGELEMNPAPSTKHQRAVTNLSRILSSYVVERRLGTVLVAPCDVVLSETNVLEPDILYVARERDKIIGPAYVDGPPALVVEVLSPSTSRADWLVKWHLYARFSVPHYWVLDPLKEQAFAYVLQEKEYSEVAVARGLLRLTAPPFPDLSIDLAEVWV